MNTQLTHGKTSRFTYHALLLVDIWTLILAKCLTLEFLVYAYSIPINSVLYVWSLSFFMAAAASFVFLNLRRERNVGTTRISSAAAIWLSCVAGVVLLTAASIALESLPMHTLPACIALLIGFGFGAHGLSQHRKGLCLLGISWWLGTSLLFRISGPLSMLFLAFLLIVLMACPVTYYLIRIRRSVTAP